MRTRGTDGLMLARNRVLAELERGGPVTSELCELANWIICGDEGLPLEAIFPPEAADKLASHCTLACHLDPRRASGRGVAPGA